MIFEILDKNLFNDEVFSRKMEIWYENFYTTASMEIIP